MSSNGWLETLRGAVVTLRAEQFSGVPGEALADDLVELRRAVDSLEAEWLRRLAAFDARGGAVETGAVSTAAWLRSECRLAPGVARDRVELARALSDRPATAAALAGGDISVGHAQQVVAAVTELAAAAGPGLAEETEPVLVEVARRVDPARLRRELVHARHALAPDAAARAGDSQYRRRRLSVGETFEGMVAVQGMLDPEGGAMLLSALTPLAARSGPDDVRPPSQRRADALVELCRRQLDTGDLPEVGSERPHLTVLVDLDTLDTRLNRVHTGPDGAGPAHTGPAHTGPAHTGPAHTGQTHTGPAHTGQTHTGQTHTGQTHAHRDTARRADADTAEPDRVGAAAGRVAAGRAGRLGYRFGPRAAETQWAGPISGEAARRTACDAAVTRVITTGASQPLDVGRRTRTVPPAIRTALIVRDRGCAFPHCDRPPAWTDAHHLHHWAHGGPTTLDNLILLCRRHHRAVHEGGWQLSRGPDHRWTAHRRHPTGASPPTAA